MTCLFSNECECVKYVSVSESIMGPVLPGPDDNHVCCNNRSQLHNFFSFGNILQYMAANMDNVSDL